MTRFAASILNAASRSPATVATLLVMPQAPVTITPAGGGGTVKPGTR